ncbi:sensor histidine kinase with ATPase domain [Psychromonas ingrahamii 37]|uniref:histidine kinase n=1 Tax=Psychromonas ingrahamii (strain DSM 17664 / CCUG 51855 / 37) TaxID=357804 RepID=A1T0X8_PSYIN|nr:response regulator [Psychromonas ingrahamii]ABM05393.1 sensor histidine kinase with ATPase domain [Psychromonas ingrahamii 37]
MKFKQSIASRLVIINLIRALVAIIVVASMLYTTREIIKSNEELDRAHQTLEHTLAMQVSSKSLLINGYGFLKSGNPEFLQTFEQERNEFDTDFAILLEGLSIHAEKSKFTLDIALEIKHIIDTWLVEEVEPQIIAQRMNVDIYSPKPVLLKSFLYGNALLTKVKDKQAELIAEEKSFLLKQQKLVQDTLAWAQLVFIGGILIFMMLGFVLSYFAATGITRRIGKLVEATQRLAKGDLDVVVDITSQDEIGLLGEYTNQTIQRLQHLEVVVKATAAEDFATQVRVLGQQDQLALSINKMSENLKNSAFERKNQTWLKNGIAELHSKMRSEHELVSLSQLVITYLAKYLNAQVGSCYLAEGKQLQLVSSYAFKRRNNNDNVFQFGEGLIGQAALEQQSILYHQLPDDHNDLLINTGISESTPTDIFVLPLVHENKVQAVLALGVSRKYSQIELEFLESVASGIAITLHVTRTRQQLVDMLEESKLQSEELQAQQEELRASNEELEEQSTMLVKSEESLRNKSEELQQINSELEERSEELERQTAEMTEKNTVIERAKQAVEIQANNLEKASRYKSEFLANMSHELRTPLNSLLILSQSLAKNSQGNLNEEQQEDARVIYEGGQSLLALINDILDLSKVEAGKLDIHFEQFSINNLLVNLGRQFKPVANKKGVELCFDKEDVLSDDFFSDPQRIEQVLRNLLSNGIKFTHHGTVSLKVIQPGPSVRFDNPALRGRNTLGFAVSDTGIGISADNQESVFEAFQQGDGSTSRNYGGTGLGLTISRELVKLMGGEIQLQSKEGEGSTFTLYLPLDRRLGLAAKQPLKANTRESKTHQEPLEISVPTADNTREEVVEVSTKADLLKSPLSPVPAREKTLQEKNTFADDRDILKAGEKSVLVIEDDPSFMRILIDLSRHKGYRGLSALTGREGLELAAMYQPSAIVLDLGLPDISGRQVLEQLKQNINTRHIPVHILSAEDKNTEVLQIGAVGFLTKPVSGEDIDSLFCNIEHLLQDSIKRVLLVEDDNNNRLAVTRLIANKNIEICSVSTGREAQEKLLSELFHCVILDLSLPDISGFELLNRLRHNKSITLPPIIVYTGRELSSEEYKELSQYTSSIVIKGANSPERLLDETTLFLHSVDSSLPHDQRKIIKMLHNSELVLQGRKILLVDDDLRNTYALSKVLREYGLEVIMADNGKLALQKLAEEENIELVLMDIMMPVMDGYEAMRKIRSQTRFKKLPIIALTAKAMPEDRTKSIEAGANDYCIKPIDVDKLIAIMKIWLFR